MELIPRFWQSLLIKNSMYEGDLYVKKKIVYLLFFKLFEPGGKTFIKEMSFINDPVRYFGPGWHSILISLPGNH